MFTINIEKIFLFLLLMLCLDILCPEEVKHHAGETVIPALSSASDSSTPQPPPDLSKPERRKRPKFCHSFFPSNFLKNKRQSQQCPVQNIRPNQCNQDGNNVTKNHNETNHDFSNLFLQNIKDEKLTNISSQQNDSTIIKQQNDSSENLLKTLPKMKPTVVSSQDMLSFEEWRSKISEQLEKTKIVSIPLPVEPVIGDPNNGKDITNHQNNVPKVQKLSTNRARNFASHECGAKIVDSNPEADFVNRVLNEQMDEYMLNPCKIKNWFVIELCETIQPQYLELANFELYSSIPKEFSVQASEHYPVRNGWSSLGNFTATDIRSLQGFKLQNNGFVKYLKVDFLSFYGSEHYCPISLIRVFGTSLFDEVERIDNPEKSIHFAAEDEDQNAVFEESLQNFTNLDLFGSAKNAVVNVMMKAFNFTLLNKLLFKEKGHSIQDPVENFDVRQQSEILKLYPAFEKIMTNCENYFFPPNTNKTLNIPKECLFYQLLYPGRLFELMSTQYLMRKYYKNFLFFQCGYNETYYDLKTPELNSSILFKNETIGSHQHLIITSVTPTTGPTAVNVTLESSLTEPILVQTITNSLPQPSIYSSVPFSETVISSITVRSNDSSNMAETKPDNVPMTLPAILETENDGQALSSISGQSKEAVIIRLTNRIKNLEKNISLMSTYLENLSVRYRKQMEEMQKIFNETLDHFNSSARIAAEKDAKQQEQILRLQQEILLLNQKYSNIFHEMNQNHWMFLKMHIILMIVELSMVGICCLIFYISFKRNINHLTEKTTPSTLKNTHLYPEKNEQARSPTVCDEKALTGSLVKTKMGFRSKSMSDFSSIFHDENIEKNDQPGRGNLKENDKENQFDRIEIGDIDKKILQVINQQR